MARPGRAVELTPELIDAASEAYRTGMPMEAVAGQLHVHKVTLARWVKAGTDEIARRDEAPDSEAPDDPRLEQFVALATAIKDADSRFIQENLLLIRRAATTGAVKKRITTTKRDGSQVVEETMAEPQWSAAAWLLERRHNAQFGRQIRQEISGPAGGPIQVDESAEARISEKLEAYYQGVADGQSLAAEQATDA